ncbi:hypothetical protein HR060_17895 [Catenovulum sp. SM1970]|nr:hypothetical protein [Marinifaba aquimaris]
MSWHAHAKRNVTNVTIVTDILYDKQETTNSSDMGYNITKLIFSQLSQEIAFDFSLVSRQREWSLLAKQPDICLFNKVKNEEREQLGLFTAAPITAFPPNRLVVFNNKQIKDNISLKQAIFDYQLQIGFVSGRSYGQGLDPLLAYYGNEMTMIEGEFSAPRLRQMFTKGKLDAIIEFTSVFMTDHQVDASFLKKVNFYQIASAKNYVFGHIVCSQSEIGQKVIAGLNRQLSSRSVQKFIMKQHANVFPKTEGLRVKEALMRSFEQMR